MKRIDFLIRDVKRRTGNLDKASISELEVAGYFNDVIKTIVNFATRTGSNSGLLQEWVDTPTLYGVTEYDIPSDAQLGQSIDSVFMIRDGRVLGSLKKSSISDKVRGGSYSISKNKIIISGQNSYHSIRVVYNKRLDCVSPRVAKVDSILGQVLTFTSLINNFYLEDEFVTLETSEGPKTFEIESYTPTTLTLVGDLSDVVINSYILLGKDARSYIDLPSEVKPFLMRGVERLIRHRLSSVKLGAATVISEEEAVDLLDILNKPETDANYPIITDGDFLEV